MKHVFKAVTCILIISFSSSSCSKSTDASTSATAATKTQLLTSSDWIIIGLEYRKETATTWTDDYALWLACQKDNKFVFKTNNSYEFNEGASKCNPSDPQILQAGTWQLTSNETVLAIQQETNGTDAFNANIESLTSNSLIFSYITKIGGSFGSTYYYKYSFKR